MANTQKYFEKFHKEIRMDYDMNKELAEKRDIILGKIKKSLEENKNPSFSVMLQGSYIMKTGVKPVGKLDYDIDVGLKFYINKNQYAATDVRKWVYDAIKKHTNDVKDRGPCIRVTYEKGFNVDLVIYAVEQNGGTEIYSLAHKDKGWRPTDPVKLLDHVDKINGKYKGTEDSSTSTTQFRRVVRCLKRWDDEAVPFEANKKPSGIAYTLLVNACSAGPYKNGNESDDSALLYQIAATASNAVGRIQLFKPTPEYEDLFSKLTQEEMDGLKTRFTKLRDALYAAKNEQSIKKACKTLQDQFGSDFPVPDDDSGTKSLLSAAVAPSGLSFPNKPVIPTKPGKFA